MNFPLSREQLQNIANKVQAEETDNWIQLVVEDITECIIKKAYTDSSKLPSNVPIDIDSLGKYNQEKGKIILLPLCFTSKNRTKYSSLFTPSVSQQKVLLPLILEHLQGRFPDTLFQYDPLMTYLLIDWS